MQDLNQTATVVIIGAGPAGTAAAISLAMRGVKSVIVEAGKFPRDRPRETFHPGSEAIFSLLGVRDQVERNCEIRPTGRFVQRTLSTV